MVGVFRSEVRQAREALAAPARPWERTGSIDVEALAAWAYGVQMVERFERAGLHAIEAEAAGFEPSGYSADGVGQLMKIEHLGCRIDGVAPIVSDVCHPVAYALAAALADVAEGRRVRYHALSGTRPKEWIPPKHYARAAVWKKPWEEAQVEYQGPGRKGGYCQVILLWDRQREAWGREQYGAWWNALADLSWRLSTRALGFSVTGPSAPAEPWLAAAEATPRGSSDASIQPMRNGSAGGAGF
jgi:hypothetical protein